MAVTTSLRRRRRRGGEGGEDRGHLARLAVLGVLVGEPGEFGVAVDVALDEVDAVGVVDGDDDGDAAVDVRRNRARRFPAVAREMYDRPSRGTVSLRTSCRSSAGNWASRLSARSLVVLRSGSWGL